MEKKYHYFYRIKNVINGHFYYGVHNTNDLNDGYMGSGIRLKNAIDKYGHESFTKEILKFFDSAKKAFEYEAEVVTEELVRENDCYNLTVGGKNMDTTGKAVVVDKEGNRQLVDVTDEKYISGELSGATHGTVLVRANDGTLKRVSQNDECYKNGELKPIMAGKFLTKDSTGKYFMIDKADPRYLSGQLKHIWSGRKHSQESIEKIKARLKEINHQSGEKNSQYGTCWINNGEKAIKIKKCVLETYLNDGWKLGRKLKQKGMDNGCQP